jgi:hypothetical protein
MQKELGETFDWNKFLKNAIRRKTPLDKKEWDKVESLARDWVTCACGNQCSVIPRDEDNEPLDDTLRSLGIQFHRKIQDCNWKDAKEILKEIEHRSVEIIDEISKEYIQGLEELGYCVVSKKQTP